MSLDMALVMILLIVDDDPLTIPCGLPSVTLPLRMERASSTNKPKEIVCICLSQWMGNKSEPTFRSGLTTGQMQALQGKGEVHSCAGDAIEDSGKPSSSDRKYGRPGQVTNQGDHVLTDECDTFLRLLTDECDTFLRVLTDECDTFLRVPRQLRVTPFSTCLTS
uniref:Uncharacterized protein n=1 Tax=Timema poppense TaxID=170557 RepID=A0A7R9CFT1_TIMPO|nr:unnamed protein product [Timema poppensis]